MGPWKKAFATSRNTWTSAGAISQLCPRIGSPRSKPRCRNSIIDRGAVSKAPLPAPSSTTTPTTALDLAPAPNYFPVAAPGFWADDRKHGERTSPPHRHTVASDCGNLAPPPGTDLGPPKPKTKSVNHFTDILVS